MLKIAEGNILYYLLEKGLVHKQEAILNPLLIETRGSRNNNICFVTGDRKYLIKQVREFQPDKIDTLHRESCIYYLAFETDYLPKLKEHIPKFFDYNYEENILTIEYFQGSQMLQDVYFGTGKFYPDYMLELGKIIGSYYADIKQQVDSGNIENYFREKLPWSFGFGIERREAFQLVSNADHHLYDLVASNETYKKNHERIKSLWQKNSLIHGDIKWMNFLVVEDQLKIIDWEITDIGDIWWDVAGAIHSSIIFWMNFRHKVPENEMEKYDALLDRDIEAMIKGFQDSSGLIVDRAVKEKLIQFISYRLLQTAVELAHHKSQFDKYLENMYSLSSKFIEMPDEAIQQFLKF